MKYEVSDKGASHMRSAVKTTRLLNILHLNLTDNMLGFKEAQLLSGLIRGNTPLRILNLSQNHFAHDSALILGDALLENDRMKSLDVSFNRIGDLGIRNILYPLLIHGLTSAGTISENSVAFLSRQQLEMLSRNPDLLHHNQLEGPERRKHSGLKAINLRDNY